MVAVLMTDLEGSTAMAQRLGPAAAEDVRLEHFALLRDALERTGGREVKSLGDGLMVVVRRCRPVARVRGADAAGHRIAQPPCR